MQVGRPAGDYAPSFQSYAQFSQFMLSLMQPPYGLAAYMLLVIFSHAYPAQDLMRRCHQSISSYTIAHRRLLLVNLVL
jgi:hypothetical protein